MSLLNYAVLGDFKRLCALLDQGSDINQCDSCGRTALHRASINEHCGIIEELIKRGADINFQANDGRTPLHDASFHGNSGVIRCLLQNGVKINILDNNGSTPLRFAVIFGYIECVQILLEYGADIDIKYQGVLAKNLTKNIRIIELLESYENPIKEPCEN